MMNEYKNIINKTIFNNYEQVLVIDVLADKVYKYLKSNGDFSLSEQTSYVDYFNTCKNFVYEDYVQDYIDSLSITKLENSNNHITLNYRMLDDKIGSYMDYTNNISLYSDDGKKIIVVLVSKVNNIMTHDNSESTKPDLEGQISKLTDAVSMAVLKIHNVINMDNNLRTKDEYVISILNGLISDFPELNKSLNDNASEVYNSGKTSILIVDDDKMTCSLIAKIFDKQYNVITANNGKEAIDIIANVKNNGINVSCIFLDLIMPEMDGFAVLDYLNDENYLMKIPVIIISGNYDKETRNKAYSYQIADMLEKPFNAQVVSHRIKNLIHLYRSSGILNEMMLEQHQNLKEIINSLVKAYEIDNHSNMDILQKYVKILAMQLSVQYPEFNINNNMIEKLASSARYYSIGNYTLPKSIMYKKDTYTEEEKNIIKSANIYGSSIVKSVLSNNSSLDSQYCYEITRYYNERYDGTGYPEKLDGNNIPLSAQIASLAIEYMNLIKNLVPVDYEKVASLIIVESGRKFNPKIVEAFKNVKNEFEAITKVGG